VNGSGTAHILPQGDLKKKNTGGSSLLDICPKHKGQKPGHTNKNRPHLSPSLFPLQAVEVWPETIGEPGKKFGKKKSLSFGNRIGGDWGPKAKHDKKSFGGTGRRFKEREGSQHIRAPL